jgi:cytochrome c553
MVFGRGGTGWAWAMGRLGAAVGALVIGVMPMAAEAAGTPAMEPLCASCHGAQGISTSPTIPNLAGQKQGYLENALAAYKAGQRQGPQAAIMHGIAIQLSDADIAALTAYYSSLKGD